MDRMFSSWTRHISICTFMGKKQLRRAASKKCSRLSPEYKICADSGKQQMGMSERIADHLSVTVKIMNILLKYVPIHDSCSTRRFD